MGEVEGEREGERGKRKRGREGREKGEGGGEKEEGEKRVGEGREREGSGREGMGRDIKVCLCARAQVNAAESPAHTRTRAATHTHPACAERRAPGTVPQLFRALPAHTCTKHAHMYARTTHPLTDVYKNADSHQILGPVPLPPPTLLGKRQNETGS